MRLQNWDVELSKYLTAMRSQPHEWGASDCVLFAAGAVEIVTGSDFAAQHRGKYADEESARAYMAAHGWGDVDDVASAFLARVDVASARRADIVMVDGELGKSLGVCLGRFSHFMSAEGARTMATRTCVAAWRVG